MFVLISIINPLFAQPNLLIHVATDRPSYIQGDTIHIYVRAINLSTQADTLYFGSSCLAAYIIDSYDYSKQMKYAQILTSCIIGPQDSVTWTFPYPELNSNQPVLTSGNHHVLGEVLNHGISDTLIITVSQFTAKYLLKRADSLALTLANNASLAYVESSNIDTAGKSNKWTYTFFSFDTSYFHNSFSVLDKYSLNHYTRPQFIC